MMLFVATMAAMGAWAATEMVNGVEWTYQVSGGSATITDVPTFISNQVEIPQSLNGYQVTGIRSWAFSGCNRIKSINIPSSVTSIGDGAFSGCSSLTDIVIPLSVRTIGSYAFDDCYDLESISIPSSVRTIGEYAFDDCFRLKFITVASGNAAYEFTGGLLISKDKTQLVAVSREVSTVKIPEGVREIPDGFFAGCNKLTSVSIPSSIDEYGIGSEGSVFSCWYERYDEMINEWYEETIGCPNLKTITVASGNPYYKSIGGMLCSVYDDEMSLETVPQALTDVIIPEEVTDVYSKAFEGCAKLKAIKVASGNRYYKSVNGLLLTKDGKELVWVPNALTSVTIPDGVVDLGWAFDGCEKLTSVKIPDSVVAVGRSTFSECPESLFDKKTIPGCITVDGWIVGVTDEAYERYGENGEEWNLDLTKARGIAESAFYRGQFSSCDSTGIISGLHSIVIPKNIIAVGDRAFYRCENLSSVTIESGVRHIAATAFDECHESLYDDTTLPGFRLVDGWLIDREYYYDDSIKSLDLTGLRGVAGNEVNVCCGWNGSLFAEGMTNLVVGDGMTAISHGAFAYSYELEEVEIADSVAFIGENAFLDCRNLKRVKMPDSLRGKVPASAFSQCSPGLQIEYYKSIFTVEFDANYPPFSNHDGVENVIESRSVESGETIGALPTSVLSKYKFLGWYTAPEGGTKISATTKVTGNVTYYAQWVYDGSASVSVVVAEGCEAMGKVTGGTTAKVGTKVTLKSTANKGYVFAGWDGPLDESQDSRNPSISYVVGEDDAEFVAYFIPVSDDWVDVWLEMDSEYTTGEEIDDIYVEVDSGSLATLKFKSLPSGLKYTAKAIYDRDGELLHEANTIYGTPKKSGVYTVTVTATTASKKTSTSSAVIVVRKENEKMVKLAVQDWYDEETDTSVVPGKVSGGGIFAEGKKVSLKATANKGFVFAGWWDVNADDWFYGPEDYRNPRLSYVMADSDVELEAVFMPASEDWVEVWLDMDEEYTTGEEIDDIYVEVDSGSLATLKFKGLPSGLKYTAKAIYDRSGNLLHEANTIYGTPKKSGVYTVTVTATTASKKKSTGSAVIVVRKENEKMVKLAVQDWYDEETDTSVIPGKVSGGGIFAEGKKVSLKATANKGFVFAGWWDVNAGTWLDSAEDYRNPKLSYVMTDSDMELEAVFAPFAEDNVLDLYIEGYPISANADDNVFDIDGEVDVKLEIDSLSLSKASVSGLPKGLKFDAKTNMITGVPTAPGFYIVTVKLTNQSIKNAIEKKFTISVSNLTGANDYFVDGLYNGVGEKYSLSVGISNVDDFLPSLELNRGTLAVSGLPAGLKYDATNGRITGVATKAGTYTVTLTVTDGKAKYVSTITIAVEALPDWVVGTFEGYAYVEVGDGGDYHDRIIYTISSTGKKFNWQGFFEGAG